MASFGIPYQGSKSRIATWVVPNLPSSPVLVDLFAGEWRERMGRETGSAPPEADGARAALEA